MVENIETQNERRIHRVAPRYISVDGPDGVGKDTLVKHIAVALKTRIPHDEEVVIASPNLFKDTPESQRIGNKFQENGAYSQPNHRINNFYLAAYNRNAKGLILPSLERDSWVVAASSELRPIAFTNAERPPEVAIRTQELMLNGSINQGVWPKHRIILESDPDSLLSRIIHRGEHADDDPLTVDKCHRRISSYEWAIQLIQKELPAIGKNTRWYRQTIRTVNSDQIDDYMQGVAEEIANWVLER